MAKDREENVHIDNGSDVWVPDPEHIPGKVHMRT